MKPEALPENDRTLRLCISTNEMLHLLDEYESFYNAAIAIKQRLQAMGIQANVVEGGLQFFAVSVENIRDADTVLQEFKIDIERLSEETFREKLRNGATLEKLSKEDPLGFASRMLQKISGSNN